MCKNSKCLKVLDVHWLVDRTPHALVNLTQLTYLELRIEAGKFPRSIGNLRNLQTLRLGSFHSDFDLPDVIWKLRNLRHLQLEDYSSGNLRLDTLSHLQTLTSIVGGRWIDDGDLSIMTNLRKLEIWRLLPKQVNQVVSIVEKFVYLRLLTLLLKSGESFGALTQRSRCVHLQKLTLEGRIVNLPDPHEFPPNLVKLTLWRTHLQQDAIRKLERLPNLTMLSLNVDSYGETKLVCSSQGFPQLQILHVTWLGLLEELIVEQGAMLKLKSLMFEGCRRLEKVPEAFQSFTTYLHF